MFRNTSTLFLTGLVVLVAAGCGKSPPEGTVAAKAEIDTAAEAQRIARDYLIADTHIDVPYRLKNQPDDVAEATTGGDFDYPRAVAGGLNAAFMSIYTPAEHEAEGTSRATADELIDMVEDIVRRSPDKFAIARSPADLERHFKAGVISLPMGMENGSPLEGDLANLEFFFERGIRYITPSHSLSNHIADSSYDDNRQWGGLSEFGVEVIREMNRLGIMIDVSHVSDETFWQILDLSEAPALASHSSARHFTPEFERNMSDEMIRALADRGGVIHINFGSSFVTARAREYSSGLWPAMRTFREQHPDLPPTEAGKQARDLYVEEYGPYPYASLADVLDHFDHVVELVGVDHVGIGSDYDGVGDSLPVGLKDVSSYPNLIEGLLQRGYNEADIRKILGGNLLRVWRSVEAHAASQR